MGYPLAPLLVNIFMASLKEDLISTGNDRSMMRMLLLNQQKSNLS